MRRLLFALLLWPMVALAGMVDSSPLPDAAAEARAQSIMRELRCLVCQNESIAESQADLAADLRQIVRERVAAGDSDAQVKQFLVARYGEWVLMKPKVEPRTWLLWLGPLAVLLLGLWRMAVWLRRGRPTPNRPTPDHPAPLNEAEQRRLDHLMRGDRT